MTDFDTRPESGGDGTRRERATGDGSEPLMTRPVSGWAIGGTVFAATVMVLIGVFQALQGLVAIFDDSFYVVVQNYTFDMDVTGWGWVHLIVGVLVALAGFYLFAGSPVAGGVAIFLAGLSAIANFFFIPYYPFWALLIIAIDIFVIWAIARSGIFDT